MLNLYIFHLPETGHGHSDWLDDTIGTFGESKKRKTHRKKVSPLSPSSSADTDTSPSDIEQPCITTSVEDCQKSDVVEESNTVQEDFTAPVIGIEPNASESDLFYQPLDMDNVGEHVDSSFADNPNTMECEPSFDAVSLLISTESATNNESPTFSFQYSNTHHKIKAMIFTAVLCVAFIVGLLIPLRPSFSNSEKRELSKFPVLTWASFSSGTYFNQIETWYADTYPMRDTWIALNSSLQSLYGFKSEVISGASKGEDIPDSPGDIQSDIEALESSSDTADSSETIPSTSQDGEIIESLYVKGDMAFELYYFNKTNAIKYAKLISDAATLLGENVQVYDMIVPLSYSIYLDVDTQKAIGVSDASAAISYMYSAITYYNSNICTINILETLAQHDDEYLYFRSDHHWTALGAYYAYEEFAKCNGILSTPIQSYTKTRKLEGFLGTLYQSLVGSNSKAASKLAENPDYVLAYVPNGTNDNHITLSSGETLDSYGVVNNVSNGGASAKYQSFLGGDFPLCEIHNPTITDGSSIVVVKESFGNAFVPFLVDSYEYVYVIDYRYYSGSLVEFVNIHNISQVLFINYIFATGSTSAQQKLESILK